MSPSDALFRYGLAEALGGFGAIALAVTVQLAGLAMGPPYTGGMGWFGLLIGIPGAIIVGLGVLQIERSARMLTT